MVKFKPNSKSNNENFTNKNDLVVVGKAIGKNFNELYEDEKVNLNSLSIPGYYLF